MSATQTWLGPLTLRRLIRFLKTGRFASKFVVFGHSEGLGSTSNPALPSSSKSRSRPIFTPAACEGTSTLFPVEYFGEEAFLVISGDALTDIDLRALAETHRSTGGIATLAVKQVPDTREFGVVLHDREGRITGFQEKPSPDEALSDLGNCGIYVFDQRIFDYFPDRPFVDWAKDIFPVLLENDVPFYIHEVREYWNDIGSLSELRKGTFDGSPPRLLLANLATVPSAFSAAMALSTCFLSADPFGNTAPYWSPDLN